MKNQDRSQLWLILSVVFLGFLGISLPYLIFPALFLKSEISILNPNTSETIRAILLGITLAVYPIGQFIGSPILGSLSDDYGRKKILVYSLIFSAFSNFLSGLAISFGLIWLLIFSRFLSGILEGNVAIARAMATELSTISKHESFGKINASSSIAYLIGPLFGGIMTDQTITPLFKISTPFYFITIFLIALSLFTQIFLKNSSINIKVYAQSFFYRINIIKKMKVLLLDKKLSFLIITSTIFTLSVDIFYEFGPVHLTSLFNLSPKDLISYNSLLCLALAVGNGFLPNYLQKKHDVRVCVILSMISFAIFLAMMSFSKHPTNLLILFTLSGLAIGSAVTLLTVKISDRAPAAIQGEIMGFQLSLRVLGDGIICLIGASLLLISSKTILILASFVAISSMLYYLKPPILEKENT
jgi:DHA1 family tetracycline resistance protein-like MFS transporter